jgi:VWFA-related protein
MSEMPGTEEVRAPMRGVPVRLWPRTARDDCPRARARNVSKEDGPLVGRLSLVRSIAAVVLLAALALAPAALAEAPLTTADVVRFLRAGLSERTILVELTGRGFAETLDDTHEAALREAGASETLVVAVRRAAPEKKEPEPRAAAAARPAVQGNPIPDPREKGSTPIFRAGTRTVRVPVSVQDKRGQPVMGLRFEDFRISDGGKPQTVTLFSGERRALRLVLALDVSGSMKDKIRQVEAALRHFIALLEPTDEVMVVTFSDHVHVVQDFTSDRDLLERVLNTLEAEGATALFDAVEEAIRRVSQGPAESKAVVLVTDGVDSVSTASFGTLRELARRAEVPVFSIGIDSDGLFKDSFRLPTLPRPGVGGRDRTGGPRRPGGWPGGMGWPGGGGRGGWPRGPTSRGSGKLSEFDARPLLDLAEETGGRAEIVKELGHYRPGVEGPVNDSLKAAVESIAITLRHRYLLGYEPPEGKGGWRTIRVDVDRPSTTARTRKGYYSND